ncbi:Bifunctional (p)ppGpp synthetase/guanosine-3',5'-bis(diphosphate) 3'-pyrophosphohydrolase [Candidatus Trichorickettsia mobilis]|uniref:GTP pyrophosphokinase rsh n=1 Tax=Candidatus Trichorickettsia mobilis TaxID=1346319 RepID=A0ABZ0UVE4_9RICK|nr:bifunctional (p)ppGpp synthetase/guanosine-3',5'-bis(diphosphate) 3'-pyrophosphohydrolase [Candidatus Trichorickettsia mobilis]WPY00879.1 Bifunctional (p)ppGpp synthetase/guanosine-3',5'-bis(diphosphate) 3'-pyrophosphohydrolase [Candidatus Trichorickettsia mobilis]
MNHEDIVRAVKSYDPNCNEAQINKAIDFAISYHGAQTRESGEPYYYHPLEVAEIITEMHLDSDSVIAGILHDTIEDTDLTLGEIEQHFGSTVSKLVDGVTKLSKIEFMPDNVRQAENFRKLLLAMSDDIRILLIKLADRLHNMRTIDSIKSLEKRTRIAVETMEIYAPLAERIGIQQIKVELQDICFRILQPEARESILNRLHKISADEGNLVDNVIAEFTNTLKSAGIKAIVHGRHKTPYSIWMKMQQKNIGLEQLSDIVAFRIIVDTIPHCYQTLGIIHTKYQMVPDSFQDFISTPKNNGYKSLHTVIIGPLQQKIEVQIRTDDMHDIAELGVAAHWRYKQQYHDHDVADGTQYRWIRELLAILEQAGDPEDFLQNTKLAMYYDQVFCFTPKGNLIALPKGATCVDFAYAVHSDVGHHCVGAKINGCIVPLRSTLENGDQVEIIVSKNKTPSPSWQKFVITGKAHSEIKRFTRNQQKEQYIKLGKAIVDRALSFLNIVDEASALDKACTSLKKQGVDDLLYAIGDGSISSEELMKYITPKQSKISSTLSLLKFNKSKKSTNQALQDTALPIQGLIEGMAIHLANCCNPLLGDKIVGVVHTGNGVTVHTADCSMLSNINAIPERLIPLTWDSDKSNIPFICRLKITILNELGSMAILCSEIAKKQGNIINFKITNRTVNFFEIILDMEVQDVQHIEDIINVLQSKSVISQVERHKS